MHETVIPKTKRFIPIKRYCEISGLSYATVTHMLNTGQLNFITTESGQRRIDTEERSIEAPIIERLDKTEKMLSALCRQFNVSV